MAENNAAKTVAMSSQAPPQPEFSKPLTIAPDHDDSDEWEYEYSTTETEVSKPFLMYTSKLIGLWQDLLCYPRPLRQRPYETADGQKTRRPWSLSPIQMEKSGT